MKQHLSKEKVLSSIQLLYNFLNSNIASTDTDGVKRSGFVLDVTNPASSGKMGIGATSLALSIYALNPNKSEDRIAEMERFVCSKQKSNGSWTITPLIKYNLSLVYTTCYVLQSLCRANYQRNSQYIDIGISWLLSIVNDDGGWGLTEKGPSHIHPTSEVLFLFSLMPGPINSRVFIKAKKWLLEQKGSAPFWVNEEGRASLFLTALAYRAIVVHGNFHYQLRDTREWLIQNVTRAACREETTYYIPVGKQHIPEPVSCFTRAMVFEALTSGHYFEYQPHVEKEAKRILDKQNPLGYWQCDTESKQVPMYLNYYIAIGLMNYYYYLESKPKNVWLIDSQNNFKKYPLFYSILYLIATWGLIQIVFNIKSFTNLISAQIQNINAFFMPYSGLANFFGITGLSVVAVLVFVVNKLRQKKDL